MTPELQTKLDSVRADVEKQNLRTALALTLALPDICASIEYPNAPLRYNRWWDDNFGQSYRYGTGQTDFLNGVEVFLLRCAYLHEGSDSLDPKSVKKYQPKIVDFTFVVSDDASLHLKIDGTGTRLQLNAATFCRDMCSKVEEWDKNVLSKDPVMQAGASKLLKIYAPQHFASTALSSARVTVRLLRACEKCGERFPQEEHERLCSNCR
jgi:hypothetical protein